MLSRYRETEMKKENVPGIVELEGENLRQPFAKPRPFGIRGGLKSAISSNHKVFGGVTTSSIPSSIYDGNTWEGLRRREQARKIAHC